MKRLLFVFFIVPTTAIAQSKIDGVGPFRIGKSTSSTLDKIASENNITINTRSTSMDRYLADGATYKITKNIFLLKEPGEDEIQDSYYKHSKDVKVYMIDYIEISSIPFIKLYLSFYKDTLYSIHTEGSTEIIEAMTTKYGEPKLNIVRKKVKCTSRIAGNYEVEEITYNSEWTTGLATIKAKSDVGVFYNSKCQKLQYSYFSIENEAIVKRVNTHEERLIKEKGSATKEQNKKALTNF